ncbi:P-type ATPase, partial [Enterococcus faecium]|uniref:P-type ATPase n=1 Tax=Enterococcus faecium TaxID=1352 RepID=UPI003F74334F
NERAIEASAEQPDLLAMKNMVFAGTSVSKGNAKILVTKIGMSTEFGKIAHLTQDVTQTVSPLQVELNRATKQISIIAISIGLFFLLAAVVFIHEPISKSFVFSLGMIVAF